MENNIEKVNEIISTMTLEEKVGQLFLLAFPGKDAEKIESLIDKYQICGCYISQDNAETFDEAKKLTERIQKRALEKNNNLPLILGVDQEGAWGVLLPESKPGPGNLALGAANEDDLTYKMHAVCASEMQSVGYNSILGPCADINLNALNPIIGTRSFGEDPQAVARHVKAAVKGLNDYGVLSAAKHFPGHGDTSGDTHREIPVVDKSLNELLKNDLYPFQAAIDAGVDMIMTSHIKFPQIDDEYPATLSKKILEGLLREQMNFNGVIITDSMNMGGIRNYYAPEESIIMALKAGSDILMLSEEHYDHSEDYLDKQLASIEGVISAVKNGTIDLKIIEERLRRIITLKLDKINSLHERKKFEREECISIEALAARKAVTIVENKSKLFPLDLTKKIVMINATPRSSYDRLMNSRGIGPNQELSAFDTFKSSFENIIDNTTFFDYEEYKNGLKSLDENSILIVVTEDYPLPGEDFEKEDQQKLVKDLISEYNDQLVIVGLRSPYEFMKYEGAGCYISAFSSRTCSAVAAAEALAGKYELNTSLPVSLGTTC